MALTSYFNPVKSDTFESKTIKLPKSIKPLKIVKSLKSRKSSAASTDENQSVVRTIKCKTSPIEQLLLKDIDKFLEYYERIKKYAFKHNPSTIVIYNKDISPPLKNLSWNEYIRDILINLIGLRLRELYKIAYKIKHTFSLKYCLSEIIKNPYNFIEKDGHLITFTKAEFINKYYNLNTPIETRCEKWIYNYMLNAQNSFYIEKWRFYKNYREFCLKNNEALRKGIIDEVCVEKYIDGKQYLTTQYLYEYEKKMGDIMMELFYDVETGTTIEYHSESDEEIENMIREYEMSTHEQMPDGLTDEQRQACLDSYRNKFNIICGLPGSGKTTIAKCIIDMEYKKNSSVNIICLSAPTGLAVKNLFGKCPVRDEKIVGTLHKLIYDTFPKILDSTNYYNRRTGEYDGEDNHIGSIHWEKEAENIPKWIKNAVENNYHKCIPDIIIVDEISMVDNLIFNELLDWCIHFNAYKPCKLLLIGDHKQLPSVGPGDILRKFIETNIFNVNILTKIQRQNSGTLSKNILRMAQGKKIKEKHFDNETMIFKDNAEFIIDPTEDKWTINEAKLNKFLKDNNLTMENTHFITPQHKGSFGVENLNNILQNIYNRGGIRIEVPSTMKYKPNYIFKYGDKIVRMQNDYQVEGKLFANGDTAVILKHDDVTMQDHCVIIAYDDGKREDKSIENLYKDDEFQPFYCGTVHKSQGCEYPNIVLFVSEEHWMWRSSDESNKLLYTGISRGQQRCFIIGNWELFQKTQTNPQKPRISLFLEEFIEFDVE